MAAIIVLKDLQKAYRGKEALMDGLNLTVENKDFKVVFGLPGCGKSVLMRMIMGLELPDQGEVYLRGREVSNANPGEHNIGYVPQSFALFPHQTVYQNIAYPLRVQKRSKAEIDAEVHRVAKMLSIEDLLGKKPDQTSGGQKQRIAIARGIIKHTDLYIFDDPFVGLDFKLREQLVYDLRDLQEKLDATFVYTTSDSSEALQLSKSISILHGGRILETNGPFDLYNTPRCADSMRSLGFPNANMLEGKIENGTLKTDAFAVEGIGKPDGNVIVGIRPESFKLGAGGEEAFTFDATVSLREDLGGEEIVYFDVASLTLIMMGWHCEKMHEPELGEKITVSVARQDIICFDAASKIKL
jgi:ABC-type sugar transport system ATPase subunit